MTVGAQWQCGGEGKKEGKGEEGEREQEIFFVFVFFSAYSGPFLLLRRSDELREQRKREWKMQKSYAKSKVDKVQMTQRTGREGDAWLR